MLSTADYERLISAKRREIQKEKTVLGLSPPPQEYINAENDEENASNQQRAGEVSQKKVNLAEQTPQQKVYVPPIDKTSDHGQHYEGRIPPELERYIRRYIGLPVMLKAGEYSPNNPLVRGAAPRDRDVFLGLGEYEQRAKTLRRLRQREYKEYLDEQAKKKQEERQLAEKIRREQEERERELERQQLERDNEISMRFHEKPEIERDISYGIQRSSERDGCMKVDTGVQTNGWRRALSVGVQTDESDFFHLPTSQEPSYQTQAERELSPRTVLHSHDDRPLATPADPATLTTPADPAVATPDTDGTSVQVKKPDRDRRALERQSSYKPSLFDADAIQMRNAKAEQEAAKKRQYYQQDLKNQIQEQQRIREERKAREKMLEQAEMRRLEEQLRMLRAAQEKELWRHQLFNTNLKDNTTEYQNKTRSLQKEIDSERKSLRRAPAHSPSPLAPLAPVSHLPPRATLPRFHSKITENNHVRPTFSTNIPDSSLFSNSYDVDNYLRRNLNPTRESLLSHRLDSAYSKPEDSKKPDRESEKSSEKRRYSFAPQIVEQALIHREDSPEKGREKSYEPSFLRKDIRDLIVKDQDTLPIPVLRHSPKVPLNVEQEIHKLNSEAMQKIEDKWKVPAVQKNILKAIPNSEGKANILTQLGSIRRQLQLEQLKLDKMLDKGSDV